MGDWLGVVDGVSVGDLVDVVGMLDKVGDCVGILVGTVVGSAEGWAVGLLLPVGFSLGACDGLSVGDLVVVVGTALMLGA